MKVGDWGLAKYPHTADSERQGLVVIYRMNARIGRWMDGWMDGNEIFRGTHLLALKEKQNL